VEETRLNEPLMITVIILTVAIMCLFIAAALALWAPGFGGAWHPSYHRVSKKEI
jgi:ABC-type transporter Mla subunit MlaD